MEEDPGITDSRGQVLTVTFNNHNGKAQNLSEANLRGNLHFHMRKLRHMLLSWKCFCEPK